MANSSENISESWGRPLCGNCGHDLTGLVDSSKCTECGRPLVEVLVRESSKHLRFKRYASKTRILGMPAIAIARGIGPDGRPGHARGWIAIGDRATGVVALGGSARGIVAAGGSAIGVFAFGGMSVGLLMAFGGMAVAPLGLAFGGMAVGGLAFGGLAAGLAGVGGTTFGYITWGPPGGSMAVHRVLVRGGTGDPVALNFFEAISWLTGSPSGRISMFRPFAWGASLFLTIAAALSAPAILRWARESDEPSEKP